ncbi:MAG: hypothetical protein LBB88_01230 [Planctomycetaceae bacterium]|nr:hypothetical protein [Planctomycetaceae bacterium]
MKSRCDFTHRYFGVVPTGQGGNRSDRQPPNLVGDRLPESVVALSRRDNSKIAMGKIAMRFHPSKINS